MFKSFKNFFITFLAIFCTSIVAMEPNNENQPKELVQGLQNSQTNTSLLSGYSLKALVPDLKKPTWNDYKRINQVLNLLLMYEQSLCAMEQLAPILKLAEKSQKQRVDSRDASKIYDACGIGTSRLPNLKNFLLIDTPEGRAAFFQIKQASTTNGNLSIFNFDKANEFLPWLKSSHPEIRNIAGIGINGACVDQIGCIAGKQMPYMFFAIGLFKNSEKNDHIRLEQELIKICDPDLINLLMKLPYINDLCKYAVEITDLNLKSLNGPMLLAEGNSLTVNINKLIAQSTTLRALIVEKYNTLYASLEHALGKLPKKEKYFLKIRQIFNCKEFDSFILPRTLNSVKKEIRQFDFSLLEKSPIIVAEKAENNTKAVKKKQAARKIYKHKQFKKKKKKQIESIQEPTCDEDDQEEIQETQDLEINHNSANNVEPLIQEKEEDSIQPQKEEQSKPIAIPSIKYAQRIEQYFQPNAQIDTYHGFTRLVDTFLFNYGTQEKRENKTFQFTDTVYKLAGEIQYKNGQREYVVMHATKGYDDVCYHRGYETRTPDMFDNYIAESFWKLNKEPMMQNSKEDATIPSSINQEGKILEENNWMVKIRDHRLQATIILYKPLQRTK